MKRYQNTCGELNAPLLEGRRPPSPGPKGRETLARGLPLDVTHIWVAGTKCPVAGFVPEGQPILARDFSPWMALERGCVPSGRLKWRPGGFTPTSGPPVTRRGARSPIPNASPRLSPTWPGLPFQASRRDAGRGEWASQGLKSLAKIDHPSGTKPAPGIPVTCHLPPATRTSYPLRVTRYSLNSLATRLAGRPGCSTRDLPRTKVRLANGSVDLGSAHPTRVLAIANRLGNTA